jgi:hypothetical protein
VITTELLEELESKSHQSVFVGNDTLGYLSVFDHLHKSEEVLALLVESASHVFQVVFDFLPCCNAELLDSRALIGKIWSLCGRRDPQVGISMSFSWLPAKHTQVVLVGVLALIGRGSLCRERTFPIPALECVDCPTDYAGELSRWIGPIHSCIVSIVMGMESSIWSNSAGGMSAQWPCRRCSLNEWTQERVANSRWSTSSQPAVSGP